MGFHGAPTGARKVLATAINDARYLKKRPIGRDQIPSLGGWAPGGATAPANPPPADTGEPESEWASADTGIPADLPTTPGAAGLTVAVLGPPGSLNPGVDADLELAQGPTAPTRTFRWKPNTNAWQITIQGRGAPLVEDQTASVGGRRKGSWSSYSSTSDPTYHDRIVVLSRAGETFAISAGDPVYALLLQPA